MRRRASGPGWRPWKHPSVGRRHRFRTRRPLSRQRSQTKRPRRPFSRPNRSPPAADEPVAAPEPAAAAQRRDAAAVATAVPAPAPGFEERLGTRWVVWIGGLTLALGGFFMVRYSIEAGLLGPGVRILLGGAVRAGAAGRRRMDAAQGKHLRHRRAADRQHSGDPHGGRNRGRVRDGLCGLRALRLPRPRPPPSSCSAWSRSARSPRRCCTGPALAGLGVVGAFVTPRAGVLRQAGLLGALYLSRHRHRRRLRAGARIRLWRWLAVTTIALRRAVDPAVSRLRRHRWSRRTPSTSSRASFSPACSWSAASCSARRSRTDEIEPVSSGSLAPICSARR